MRIEDAPPAGWYPDPENSSRLRWWEGTDWADRYHAPPSESLPESPAPAVSHHADQVARHLPDDPQAIVDQVRMAAREEAQRAAQAAEARARAFSRQIEPLISEYTGKAIGLIRKIAIIVVILLIAWVAWQVFAQVSLLDWIGERIDRLTDSMSVGSLAGTSVT